MIVISKPILIATLAVAFVAFTSGARGAEESASDALTLSPTTAPEASTAPAADSAEELAKKLQNPVADLISVPFQSNWDFNIGPADAYRYTCNIQPVIPFSITDDWNLITRTIMPVIYAEAPVDSPLAPDSVGEDHSGLGDITQSFFLSPKAPVDGWILGAGPVFLWPTATDSELGSGKWGAGPTIAILRQEHGFTYGVLANHIWSYGGWGDTSVNATFLQPFLSYTTKTYTTFGVNTESTYDWQDSQWTVPFNFTVQQLVRVDKHPVAFQVGYRYYADAPDGGPDWGLRFTVTFLFPE